MNPTQTLTDSTQALKQTATAATGAARDLLFAGLGIVSTLEEGARGAFDRLVREGEQVETGRPKTLAGKAHHEAEADARAVRAEAQEAGAKVEAAQKQFEERLTKAVTATLRRMNVPTRDDVDELKRSVDRLNRKTEALRAA